jgi:hypothetical protein
MRTWTDSTGKHKIEAEFIEVLEGKARLKMANVKIGSRPLNELSREDQTFLKDLLKQRRAEAAAPAEDAGGGVGARPGMRRRPGGRGQEATYKKGDRVVREFGGEIQVGTVVAIDPNSGWLEVVMDGDEDQRPTKVPGSFVKPFDAAAKAALPQEGWAWTPPSMKPAVKADYSSVRRSTAVAAGGGALKPDPGAPTPTLAGVKASLISAPTSFWEKRQAIRVTSGGDGGPLALVLFRGGKEMNSADSRIEVIDLAKGERRATLSAAAKTGAMWPSPSGKRIVTAEGDGAWDQSTHLHVWELGEKNLTHLASWQPYGEEEGKNKVEWFHWLDDERLITKSEADVFVVWQVDGAKALVEFTKEWASDPALSPGGKQLALVTEKGVEIYSTETGDQLGTLPARGGWTSHVAFSPSGGRVSVLSSRGVEVLDLPTGKKLTDFYLGNQLGDGSWLDERFMIVANGLVIDTQSMCVLWKYYGGSPLGEFGSQRWVVLEEEGGRAKTATIAPVTLPHAAATAAAPQGAEALVLKPGDKVSIDVTAVDAEIAEEARAHLAQALKSAGYEAADGASAKLVASIRPGETQEMNYRSFGIGRGEEKFSVSTRHYEAVLTVDGQEVWKASVMQGAPGMVSLKEGESIQEVVAHEMGLKARNFPAAVPPNIASLKAREPRGVSELTAAGVK